ncbi:hypothetical protein Ddc_17757 [Ditylenchus destructor]|nr:hypothetical protein Ddc_17757 [Ditylenchus destructor]
MSIASSRQDKTIGTGFRIHKPLCAKLCPPAILKIPDFGQVTDFQSALRWGRVICQSIALSETNILAKFQDPQTTLREVMPSGNPENPGFWAWFAAKAAGIPSCIRLF